MGGNPEWVTLEFDEFDQPAVWGLTGAREVGVLEPGPVAGVELVAVAVPFRDDVGAVDLGHLGAGTQLGHVGAEPHCAALVGHVALGLHQVDHRVGRGRVELAGVGPFESQDVAGVLDCHALQAEAKAQAGDVVLPGEAGRRDLALHPALAEAARDHDAVQVPEAVLTQQALHVLSLNPVDLNRSPVVDPGVVQRFDHRQVGVDQAHVLADEADANRCVRLS